MNENKEKKAKSRIPLCLCYFNESNLNVHSAVDSIITGRVDFFAFLLIYLCNFFLLRTIENVTQFNQFIIIFFLCCRCVYGDNG